MLFSIIVPVYNVEDYLDECLNSIINQATKHSKDCEVILIDDGSTDRSGDICDFYEKKYHKIVKVYHNDNHGLLYARRFGYKKSSGKYIVNCDSDDLLEENALEVWCNEIINNQEPDVILFNANRYNGVNKICRYRNLFFNNASGFISKEQVLREYLISHKIVSMCFKIYKRECINVNDNYDRFGRLNTGEDSLQTIEIFTNARTFYYINQPLYDYRMGSGMTNKFDPEYYFTFKKVFLEIKKKENDWSLSDFDNLFSIKILQTAGRAITQSRYNKWESASDQINYFKSIKEDVLFDEYKKYLKSNKKYLQKDYYVLLMLLNHEWYRLITFLLFIKNKLN